MKQSKGESGMEKTKEEKKGLFFRFINGVEVIGNKLPHPFYLFTILIVVAIVLSVIFAGVSVTYESASSKGTGGEIVTVTIKNLLNKETINYVTQNLYSICKELFTNDDDGPADAVHRTGRTGGTVRCVY